MSTPTHPSRIIPMRATLITIAATAALAAGAGSASAQPNASPGRTDAAIHAQAMRLQGVHAQHVRDLPVGSTTVRVVHVPAGGDGFSLADAGIGAALALVLSAAGVAVVRRPRPSAAR